MLSELYMYLLTSDLHAEKPPTFRKLTELRRFSGWIKLQMHDQFADVTLSSL